MSIEKSQFDKAELHHAAFCTMVEDKPYPWVDQRKQELTELFAVSVNPSSLATQLEHLRKQKLHYLKFPVP